MIKADNKNTKLLIVIINYFSADLVESLIKQIKGQHFGEGITITISCVDNSADPEQRSELIRVKDASDVPIKLTFNLCNKGFGSAINIGIKEQPFDFACFINPDVSLQENTLPLLLNHALNNPDQGLWGGLTVDQYLQADFRHAWQEPSLKNTFAWATGIGDVIRSPQWQDNYQYLGINENQPYSVDCISGCCLMISYSAWQTVGGFDPDFFLYSEEVDLCRRARTLGYQPTVIPEAQLTHSKHSSEESTNRIIVIFSAKMQYANKHHGALFIIIYRLFIVIGAFLRACKSLIQGRLSSAGIWLKLSAYSLFGFTKTQPSLKEL